MSIALANPTLAQRTNLFSGFPDFLGAIVFVFAGFDDFSVIGLGLKILPKRAQTQDQNELLAKRVAQMLHFKLNPVALNDFHSKKFSSRRDTLVTHAMSGSDKLRVCGGPAPAV